MAGPILWVHGWGMSPDVWADLAIGHFPGRRHVFVSYADCRTVDDLRQVVPRALGRGLGALHGECTLGELGESQGWTVVGWSLGGMLALETVADAGSAPARAGIVRVERLAVVAAPLRFVRDGLKAPGWPERVLRRMMERLGREPERVVAEFRQAMLTDEERGNPAAKRVCGARVDFSPEGLQAGLAYLLEADLRGRWAEWRRLARRSPRILWLHGEADPIVPVESLPFLSPEERLLLPGAGHAPFATAEAAFFTALKEFIG